MNDCVELFSGRSLAIWNGVLLVTVSDTLGMLTEASCQNLFLVTGPLVVAVEGVDKTNLIV